MTLFKQLLKKSQHGFTLPEVMIGSAILAGVALAGAMLFRDQTKSQTRLDHDKALAQFHTTVGKILENNMHCNATIGNLGAASISAATPITAIQQCTANCNWDVDVSAMTTAVFKREGDFTDNTEIWQIRDISYVGTANSTGSLRIRFTYDYNPRIGTRTMTKDVMVGVRFGGGTFRGCNSDQMSSVNNLQNDLCKSLSSISSTGVVAAWDDATQTCRLNTNLKDCTAQGLMIEGIRSDGSVHCRSIGTGFSAESGSAYDGTSSACAAGTTARLVTNAAGKLKVVCQ